MVNSIVTEVPLPTGAAARRSLLGAISNQTTFNASKLEMYELKVKGVATIFIAVNKGSLDSNLLLKSRSATAPDLMDNVSYGGARVIDFNNTRDAAIQSLIRLACSESGVKQQLGNIFLRSDGLSDYLDGDRKTINSLRFDGVPELDAGYQIPDEYFEQTFYGGRFVVLPENEEVFRSLMTDSNSKYYDQIFKPLGEFLNGKMKLPKIDQSGRTIGEGRVKSGSLLLTPDFARFNNLATKMLRVGGTSNVLGVAPELGGCFGKATFTSGSILQTLETCLEMGLFEGYDPDSTPISLIGTAGGLGRIVAEKLSSPEYFINGQRVSKNISVSDCRYFTDDIIEGPVENTIPVAFGDDVKTQQVPKHWKVLKCDENTIVSGALKERFSYSDEELLVGQKPGIIIATTTGNEIQNSNWQKIPKGSVLILAHNNAIPSGVEGIEIMEQLHENGVLVIPGPPSTMGGAMTSRLEPPIRANGRNVFPKAFAHQALRVASDSSLRNILQLTQAYADVGTPISPWSALHLIANFTPN